MTTLTIPTQAAMEAFGRWLAPRLRAGDTVVLTGPLGAGKTTVTRGVGEALEVTSPVQSPTFIVAREHHRSSAAAPPLIHVDAYRISSAAELDDIDINWAESISVIEWGRPYVAAIAPHWLDIDIEPAAYESDTPDAEETDARRTVTVTAHSRTGEMAPHLSAIVEAARDFSY